jgi:NAD(P)-dependent dehydrogenase (short-subunit alcohol dehydrogenase family)
LTTTIVATLKNDWTYRPATDRCNTGHYGACVTTGPDHKDRKVSPNSVSSWQHNTNHQHKQPHNKIKETFMDLKLKGKHVLVTGASKGIGYACAQAFAEEGANVSLIARDLGNLTKAQKALQDKYPSVEVAIYSADLIDDNAAQLALDKAQARLGEVDVLVNSAGAAKRTPAAELTPQAWRDALDAKFFSYINMMNPVAQQMAKRGEGTIVNVIGAGGKTASPIHLPGGSANAALMLATAGLAAAFGPQGVRVNAVNPGQTLTERLKEGLAVICKQEGIEMQEALRRTTERVPLGRLASAEEVAHAVVFLASAPASYITGVNINMDGGTAASVV